MSLDGKTQFNSADLDGMTPEEILAAAKAQGVELTDEQLESVAGGGMWDKPGADGCPNCGSSDISYSNVGQTIWMKCNNCGNKWC